MRQMGWSGAADLERRPDVVLLDLRLPNLSGIDVMRQVRAEARLALPGADDLRYRRVYWPGAGGRRAGLLAEGCPAR